MRVVRGKHVLLIEDDALIRRQVCDVLTEAEPELTITEANDGQAGLEQLSSSAPDLVLLDLYMPNLSGVETLAEIRKKGPTPKVIIISSLDSDGMRKSLVAAGADGFIGKPFHPVELAEIVRRYLA